MTAKAKVAVVGLGRIGSAYDDDGKTSSQGPPRSHVAAILGRPDLELAAVCDTHAAAVERFRHSRRLTVNTYSSLLDMLAADRYDIIAIATPPETHEEIAITCLSAGGVRALFCEKPLGCGVASAERIANAAHEASAALAVNYHRRWDHRIARLKDEISAAGGARRADFVYVKQLRNYGAHAVDLLRQLCGEITSAQGAAPTARLRFASGCDGSLTSLDSVEYEAFDLDIWCKSARFRVVFGGQQIWRAQSHPGRFFPGYAALGEETRVVSDGPVHGLDHAYVELAEYIKTGSTPATSDGRNAIATYRVIEAIEKSAASGTAVAV